MFDISVCFFFEYLELYHDFEFFLAKYHDFEFNPIFPIRTGSSDILKIFSVSPHVRISSTLVNIFG